MRNQDASSRRPFLQGTGAAVAGVVTARFGRARAAGPARPAEPIRVALIGCGGRGTGAATNALQADPEARLVAMADAFSDRIDTSLASLSRTDAIAGRVDVPPERRFTGFDAFEKAIAADVDVVLLATPPHFRPQHLKAAIAAGKHAFAEKPVAVDAPGVRSVLETGAEARRKNLSLVSGLCWRYDAATREMVKRVHDGAVGAVTHVFIDDFRGPVWIRPRKPGMTDMEYQLRNWYYFTWLSGDFNVEQHVHLLDLGAWILKGAYPTRAHGIGGRSWRNGADHGNVYDHHAVTYEYADGLRLVAHCRQYAGAYQETSIRVIGSKGTAVWVEKQTKILTGKKIWEPSAENDKYQSEIDALFTAIRRGKPVNDSEYAANSTFMGILGREATYSGQALDWAETLAGGDALGPAQYAWGPLPVAPVAIPGPRRRT